jgi:protein gp37
MAATTIEWTRGDDGSPGRVWNPVTGCSKVSAGCKHCYAEALARRFQGPAFRPWTAKHAAANVQLHPERLDRPTQWRRPRRIFVNSTSDLFHDRVPDAYLARVWQVMAATPQHQYQVLTKRPARMRDWLTSHQPNPLPHVWCGTSVEQQRWVDVRVGALAETPAAVRFLSCEPLLGPLDLRRWLATGAIHWVIVGGESGPGARPMDAAWVRDLRDQCAAAGVAFFFKQWGGLRPGGVAELDGQVWQAWPRPLEGGAP